MKLLVSRLTLLTNPILTIRMRTLHNNHHAFRSGGLEDPPFSAPTAYRNSLEPGRKGGAIGTREMIPVLGYVDTEGSCASLEELRGSTLRNHRRGLGAARRTRSLR